VDCCHNKNALEDDELPIEEGFKNSEFIMKYFTRSIVSGSLSTKSKSFFFT
jgi:hypothetical protein